MQDTDEDAERSFLYKARKSSAGFCSAGLFQESEAAVGAVAKQHLRLKFHNQIKNGVSSKAEKPQVQKDSLDLHPFLQLSIFSTTSPYFSLSTLDSHFSLDLSTYVSLWSNVKVASLA